MFDSSRVDPVSIGRFHWSHSRAYSFPIFSIFETELNKLELRGWLLLVDQISVYAVMLLDIMLTLALDSPGFVDRLRLSVDRDLQMHAFKTVDDFAEDDGILATSQFEVPNHLLPKVAIVGRPNVGKSALFNKLAGGDIAIVNDEPGVTRDRLYARGFWGLQEFMVVDTGGLLSVPKSESVGMDGIAVTSSGGQNALTLAVKEACMAGLPGMIEWQAAAAIEDAKVILFVVDGQAGVTSVDKDIANWLRKKHSHKKIVHAVNKCEPPTKGFQQAIDCWSLGHRRSS
ncbi:hypothetical protein L7F22_002178 [Adiantum nelumboides]|nr:hypothetical protein [Adiantum nelumboides]